MSSQIVPIKTPKDDHGSQCLKDALKKSPGSLFPTVSNLKGDLMRIEDQRINILTNNSNIVWPVEELGAQFASRTVSQPMTRPHEGAPDHLLHTHMKLRRS
jgi:hypothetical protein